MTRALCTPRAAHRAPLFAAWLVALTLVSCGPKAPPITTPAAPPPATAGAQAQPAPPAPPVAGGTTSVGGAKASPYKTAPTPAEATESTPADDLRRELDRIFKAPAFDRMFWGVQVQSLNTGEVLYASNETKLLMPASNMKIVTLAAAAERLGWDYTFETKVVPKGQVERGTLRGDLVIVGSGDPTVNGRAGTATAVFEEWASRLRSAGITTIAGRVVADDRTFDAEPLGAGWSWDYLVYGYAAPVTALQFNENVAELAIRPGAAEGLPATVVVRPEGTGLAIVNHVTTSAAGSQAVLQIRRLAGSSRLDITGTVPAAAKEIVRSVAVDDPVRFFAQALKDVLVQNGIAVRGEAVNARGLERPPDVTSIEPLFVRRSAPLAEIARVLMKVSQNLYAETLVKTLGAQSGAGSVEAGEKVIQDVLESWGIAPDSHVLLDGSGLSRYNYVTAQMLVQILRHIYVDARHRQPFIDALPVAGVEGGTLARRMRGTRAAGNARAKTGSIANVRALSGFVETADGEPLAFSMLANNFTLPQTTIDQTIDLAVERLANFTRK
jgi:serine-type D-Ala-D-Ala carboxypeptidase/endopeptidase (penicillin-binding protein 4)